MRRVLLAAACVLVTASPATAARGLHGNNFFSNCRFSHVGADDPIVLPGKPGRSHSHTFFGNTSTNAFSTTASLRRARTTCRPATDTAAYWVPTVYRNGREVRPAKAQLYYVVRGSDQMRAFPAGLRVIAGNAAARAPQDLDHVYWTCGGRAVRTEPSARPPAHCGTVSVRVLGRRQGSTKAVPLTLRSKSYLDLHVNFPDCWDGARLDSPDHRSHMAYSTDYVCPASHPVKVPLIRLVVRYPLTRGAGVELASGGVLSGHADFFNAWSQPALERLVDDCFHDRPCNER
jgi:Domain of unknown function (DUF1996)